MPRIRSIHPEICESESLAKVSAEAERTLVRLWTHCDDEGRCKANPVLLKSKLYPFHEKVTAPQVSKDLKELAGVGSVVLYEVDGTEYLYVPIEAWRKWQKPQHPQPSKLPAPPAIEIGPLLAKVIEAQGPPAAKPNDFEADFAICWEQYPRKEGRSAAFKAYQARRRAGATAEELLIATRNYAAKVKAREQQYIKLGSTFYGPDFKDFLEGGAGVVEDEGWHGVEEQDRSIWQLDEDEG